MALVDAEERTPPPPAVGRPACRSALAGRGRPVDHGRSRGAPPPACRFFLAGGLKIVYDLARFAFRRVQLP